MQKSGIFNFEKLCQKTVGFFVGAVGLCMGTMPAHALTATDCRNAFGNACPSYSTSGTTSCICEGCTTPMSQVVQTANGLYLGQSCGSSSSDDDWRGTVTCRECNRTDNPCLSTQWEIDGMIFCRYQNPVTNCSTDSFATASMVASRCCQNGYGIYGKNATKCITAACSENLAPDPTLSSCAVCKSGYYGHRPIDFEGELFGGCTKCPTQGGADASSVLGNGWINGCYMPSNRTMTDDTGTYIFTQDCPYTQ